MTAISCVVASATGVGIGKYYPARLDVVVLAPPKPDPIVELDQVCRLKHLRFRIFCTLRRNKNDKFEATAEYASIPEDAIYLEDGARPYWTETGPTKESAAGTLLDSLSKPQANIVPGHSPEGERQECPTIHGGEQKEKEDNGAKYIKPYSRSWYSTSVRVDFDPPAAVSGPPDRGGTSIVPEVQPQPGEAEADGSYSPW